MTGCNCKNKTLPNVIKPIKANISRKIVLLVCVTILLQYIMVFINETGTEEGGERLSMALISLATCFCYILITVLCNRSIKKQSIVVIVGSVYLVIRTLLAGNGIGYMVNNIELLIAVGIFSSIKLPRKAVKQICIFSVIMYLLVFLTSTYDGMWMANRVFTDTKINRNHFGVLTVINMYMALTALRKPGYRIRLSYLIVYVIGLLIIIPTTSRTSLVCVALFILFHIISIKKRTIKAKKLYRFYLLCLLVSLFAVFFLAYVLPGLVGEDTLIFGRSILSGRNVIYKDVIKTLFSDNSWVFGRGILSDFTSTTSIYGTIRTNAHNQWLQMFLNYGILYLIIFVYVFISSFKRLIGKQVSASTLALVMMQILMFVYFTTESVHFYRSYACLFLVIYFTNSIDNNEKRIEQSKLS